MEAEEQDILGAARHTSDSTEPANRDSRVPSDPPGNLHQILTTAVPNSQMLAADSLTGTLQ